MGFMEAAQEPTPTPAPAPGVTPAPDTPDRPHGDPLAPEVPTETPAPAPEQPEESEAVAVGSSRATSEDLRAA